jgi:hypothetical protein
MDDHMRFQFSSVIPVLGLDPRDVTGNPSRDVCRVERLFGTADAVPLDPRHKAEDDGDCGT